MRYLVIADAHGDHVGLRTALAAGEAAGVEAVISLGDVVDCLLSSSDATMNRALDDVTVWNESLGEHLTDAILVLGNQEERVARAIDPGVVPLELSRLLEAPLVHDTAHTRFVHGHTLPGEEVYPDRWVPLGAEFEQHLLVHGHHHRNSLVELGVTRSWAKARDVTPTSDTPVTLRPDRQYLLNVGPAWGAEPSWAVVDEDSARITLHYERRRFRG